MRYTGYFLALSALFLASPLAFGQAVHYQGVPPKDPAATAEAGIISYDLSRHGESYSIELQGEEGVLATCEVQLGKTLAVTCNVRGKGDFRMRLHEEEWADFEDLGTGESALLLFERIDRDDPRAAAPETETSYVVPGFLVEVESTLTKEEIEERWNDLGKLLGHALAEVQLRFGPVKGKEQPAAEESHRPGGGGENIDLCRDGEEICSSVIGGFAGNALGASQTGCCRLASSRADDRCIQVTGRSCCANSFCIANRLAFLWSCGLDGFPWVCHPCPL